MRKKRVLSLLCALALLVTTGGVYATWNYATEAATGTTGNYNIRLTPEGQTTSKGTIAMDTSSLSLVIDQKGAGDYTAVLKISGTVNIQFTPTTGAAPTEQTNGIPLQLTFSETFGSYTDSINYTETDVDIISVPTDPVVLNGGAAAKDLVLNASDLLGYITLGSIQLETKEEYDAFYAAIDGKKITVKVSEYVAPAGS